MTPLKIDLQTPELDPIQAQNRSILMMSINKIYKYLFFNHLII
jgi:hypothetical protein